MRETLEKLGPIKFELIRSDPDWQTWNLEKLLNALREYVVRNPIKLFNEREDVRQRPPRFEDRKEKSFRAQNKGSKKIYCIYCNSVEHFSNCCDKLKSIDERRDWFRKKRLCFNCAGQNHSVRECRSRSCANCNQRHHTSLCYLKKEDSSEFPNKSKVLTAGDGKLEDGSSSELPNRSKVLTAADGKLEDGSLFMMDHIKETIHPTLVAIVKGQRFRMLLDTGAGSSFISSTLANHLKAKPVCWEYKCMETMTAVAYGLPNANPVGG